MDAERLHKFRRMRKRYLRAGRRSFRSPEEWAYYLAELDAVKLWMASLHDPYYDVAYWYWLRVLPDWAVGMRIYYSERQVRRIRHMIEAGTSGRLEAC